MCGQGKEQEGGRWERRGPQELAGDGPVGPGSVPGARGSRWSQSRPDQPHMGSTRGRCAENRTSAEMRREAGPSP